MRHSAFLWKLDMMKTYLIIFSPEGVFQTSHHWFNTVLPKSEKRYVTGQYQHHKTPEKIGKSSSKNGFRSLSLYNETIRGENALSLWSAPRRRDPNIGLESVLWSWRIYSVFSFSFKLITKNRCLFSFIFHWKIYEWTSEVLTPNWNVRILNEKKGRCSFFYFF